MKRLIRIVAQAVIFLCLGLLLLFVTSGHWLPWAAPGLLRLVDVGVDSAQRGEDGEMVLRGVRYGDAAVDLSLTELRVPMPVPLLWHGLRRNPADSGEIRVDGLEVRLRETAESEKQVGSTPGPGAIFADAGRWLALADRWLPPILLEKVSILPAGEEVPYVVPAASFRSRHLEGGMDAHTELPSIQLAAEFPADGPWTLRAEMKAWDLVFRGSLDREASGPRLQGDITLAAGSGTYSLGWKENSWIPSEAELEMDNFQMPKGIEGLPAEIGTVAVDSLALEWDGESYLVKGQVRGGQAKEELTLDLVLEGDLGMALLREFKVTGSWAHMNLSEPVRLNLETLQPEAPMRFSAFADLAGQDYYPAQGKVTGTLEANVGPGGSYPVRFALAGEDLQVDGRTLRSVDLEGSFDFPELVVDSLRIALPEGSVAEVSGNANVEERTLSLQGNADIQAGDINTLAGQSTGLEGGLHIEGEASGPWESLIHRGSARVEKFTAPGMASLSLDLDWKGEGADRLTADLTAVAGEESVQLHSGWVREGAVLSMRLETLVWSRAGGTFLALKAPAEVRLDLEEAGRLPWSGLSVGDILLVGDGRELGVQWDPPETASLRVTDLRAVDLSGWLAPDTLLPDVSLETLSLQVKDFEPLLIAETSARGSWRPDAGGTPIRARVQGRLDEAGVDLTEIRVAYGDTSLLAGQLGLPVTLHPWTLAPSALPATDTPEEASKSVAERDPFWRILDEGDLRGSLTGDWSAELRKLIFDWGGVSLEDADLELQLGGTVNRPEARLALDLNSMSLKEEWVGKDFPEIRHLQLDLVMNAENILLTQGVLELRDSGIRVTGELPYPEILRDYQEGKEPDVMRMLGYLRADAELQNWDAAVWKDYLPLLLRRQGKITGSVGVDPGLIARGKVEVSGFGLRPTLYSPPVDQIHGTLLFENRTVQLEDAGASIGGGNLTASGTVDMEDWRDPRFNLQIAAENVPVVRTTDMILRTDADISLVHAPGAATPLIQGDLRLRNSTFLLDVDPFSPNIETGPGTRPPYFSVEEEPFANWRCDLSIEGQDFLRVRSSIFSSELSASLRLTRTLGRPLLVGSIWATSGQIRFPGMGMRIESAEAFITPEDPNLLQIEVDAIGQNRLYVVTMNASGSTENPQIQFSSTPTLSNAQIIRLLATGSLDGGGAGAIGLYLGQALLGPGNGEETLADRLSVEIGQEVTESGRSTVELIYRLNDRWSIEGEYDRYDTYNLNLVRILLER